MMRPGTLVALLALAVAGCNHAGWGTPYPGAPGRYREFDVYRRVSSNLAVKVGEGSETGGGGRWGILGGWARLGGGPFQLGARATRNGFVGDLLRLEISRHFNRRLGVGGSVGWNLTDLTWTDEGAPRETEVKLNYVPLAAHLWYAPWAPFIVRGTAGWAAGAKAEFDEAVSSKPSGYFFGAGVGMSVPFPGAHFVILVDWQRMRFGDLATDLGSEDLRGDAFLWSMWYVL